MKKIYTIKKGLAAVLTAALAAMYALPCTAQEVQDVKKTETVYVICAADGTKQKVTVSDTIKSSQDIQEIKDVSRLENVRVLSGSARAREETDNVLVWSTQGERFTYQGESEDALPLEIEVSYTLDGEAIEPEALAGKSGRVEIRVDYRPLVVGSVEVNGKETPAYVPFAAMSVFFLEDDHFENVKLENAKIISLGDMNVAVGLVLPGIAQSLALDEIKEENDIDIPEYVQITADVEEFELESIMTLAMRLPLDTASEQAREWVDEAVKAVEEMSEGVDALCTGAGELQENLALLHDQSTKLVQGVTQIAASGTQLSAGATQVNTGADTLFNGASALNEGLGQLITYNDTLTLGALSVYETLLAQANEALAQAGLEQLGLTVPTLSVENGVQDLQALQTQALEVIAETARQTALAAVTAQVEENDEAITAAVEKQVRAQAGEASEDTVKESIRQGVEREKEKIIAQQMESEDVIAQIQAAQEEAQLQLAPLSALTQQLCAYDQFYQGIYTYTAGVSTAAQASAQLCEGAASLGAGAKSLMEGANTLCGALGQLSEQTTPLDGGTQNLADGALALKEGLEALNEEGVEPIETFVNEELDALAKRLYALGSISEEYATFSGLGEGMTGELRLVFKTQAIR